MKLLNRSALVLSVLALLLLCSGQVMAGTLFNSGDGIGETNTSFETGPAVNGNNVLITPHPLWAPNQNGAKWVSFRDTGYGGVPLAANNLSTPTAYFWENFNMTTLGGSLDLNVWADDTALVTLNGVELIQPNFTQNICADGPVGCETSDVFHIRIPGSSLQLGQNTLMVSAYQVGGDTFGVMYEGSQVPEPASIALFAAGMAGIFAVRRYRRSRA